MQHMYKQPEIRPSPNQQTQSTMNPSPNSTGGTIHVDRQHSPAICQTHSPLHCQTGKHLSWLNNTAPQPNSNALGIVHIDLKHVSQSLFDMPISTWKTALVLMLFPEAVWNTTNDGGTWKKSDWALQYNSFYCSLHGCMLDFMHLSALNGVHIFLAA